MTKNARSSNDWDPPQITLSQIGAFLKINKTRKVFLGFQRVISLMCIVGLLNTLNKDYYWILSIRMIGYSQSRFILFCAMAICY